MIRIGAFAAVMLSLNSCFIFDNPFDSGSRSVFAFPIVITSANYGGTYVWNAEDAAYEATVDGTPYFVLMDPSGTWCLALAPNDTYSSAISYTLSPTYRALPATSSSSWYVPVLTSVDVSSGGISAASKLPDSTVSVGDTLQVSFASTIPGSSATYQWLGSSSAGMTSPTVLGTGSTYYVPNGTYSWIRVVITPRDGAGNVIGPPATSPSVRLS
jgi:hypothetical protein